MEGEREWQKCIRVGLKVTVEKKMRGGHSRGRSTPSRKAIGSYSLFASLSLSLSLSHQDPEASRGAPPSEGVLQTRRRHAGRDQNFRAPGATETKLESRRAGQKKFKSTHAHQARFGLNNIIHARPSSKSVRHGRSSFYREAQGDDAVRVALEQPHQRPLVVEDPHAMVRATSHEPPRGRVVQEPARQSAARQNAFGTVVQNGRPHRARGARDAQLPPLDQGVRAPADEVALSNIYVETRALR
jgi:hypothetical protein